MEYTPEQLADIEARHKEVVAFMREKQLNPQVRMELNNVGQDNFAIKPTIFLADLKYAPEVKDGKEVVEAEVKEPKSVLEQAQDVINK